MAVNCLDILSAMLGLVGVTWRETRVAGTEVPALTDPPPPLQPAIKQRSRIPHTMLKSPFREIIIINLLAFPMILIQTMIRIFEIRVVFTNPNNYYFLLLLIFYVIPIL